MATSGITVYQLTRDQIITAAIAKLGVLAQGQSPSATDLADGTIHLNTALASLRAKGLFLWARKEYTFTPTTGTYLIGNDQTLDTPYPLKILQAYRTDSSSNRVDIDIESNWNYNQLPVNTTSNPTYKLSYTPNVNYGTIKLWPIPDSTNTEAVTLIYQRPFEYFTSGSETLDMPEEWYNALIYRLATLLAPMWQIPLEDRKLLRQEAKEYLEEVEGFGQEDASFYIMPTRDY